MEIKNWGGTENACMRGYIDYALDMIDETHPDLKLSDEQRKILSCALTWATDDKTAKEAFEYHNKKLYGPQ